MIRGILSGRILLAEVLSTLLLAVQLQLPNSLQYTGRSSHGRTKWPPPLTRCKGRSWLSEAVYLE